MDKDFVQYLSISKTLNLIYLTAFFLFFSQKSKWTMVKRSVLVAGSTGFAVPYTVTFHLSSTMSMILFQWKTFSTFLPWKIKKYKSQEKQTWKFQTTISKPMSVSEKQAYTHTQKARLWNHEKLFSQKYLSKISNLKIIHTHFKRAWWQYCHSIFNTMKIM